MAGESKGRASRELRAGVVLRVGEEGCEVFREGRSCTVGYAAFFPSPRAERVSPGHLVATTSAPDDAEVVIWRWLDAIVVGEEGELVRLWEPSHGEVLARPRTIRRWTPGTRAYASAGLPGADWWVAGPTEPQAEVTEIAQVEFDELQRFLSAHDLWDHLI